MSSVEVAPMPQPFRPALRASSSVPSELSSLASRPTLQRAGTVAEFVDLDDRIMGEEWEEVSSPMISSPLTPLRLNKRSSTPSGVSTAQVSNAIQEMPQSPTLPPYSPLVFSAPRPFPKQPSVPYGQGGAAHNVQHEPYAKHQTQVPHNHSDSLVSRGGADVSPFTFEHPFLVRPRNVRGKHPMALAPLVVASSETKQEKQTIAQQSERRVHNPYSFTTTLYSPSEDEAESLSSSEPNSPTSSSDDSARLSAHEYTSAPNTLSSHSSTNSMSSEWSTPESTQHTHVQEQMAQLAAAYSHMVPQSPVYGAQVYCRPQPYSMPPQAVCGPYCGHHNHHHGSYPTCSVTPAPQQQNYYIGYEYCGSPTGINLYQQQQSVGYGQQIQPQYLCVPSSVVSGDSHSESENGISDDGRSVLSANASLSISGIEESSTASVMGTEGMKKKRYRARCPTCSTTPDVKRLRFKRGFTYFVCLACHFKWRLQGAK